MLQSKKKSLNLVDIGDSSNEKIDLLTCVDFYWKLVNGETEKIKDVGLFAINSILGWLLKGQISKRDDIVANSVNLIQSLQELKVSWRLKIKVYLHKIYNGSGILICLE